MFDIDEEMALGLLARKDRVDDASQITRYDSTEGDDELDPFALIRRASERGELNRGRSNNDGKWIGRKTSCDAGNPGPENPGKEEQSSSIEAKFKKLRSQCARPESPDDRRKLENIGIQLCLVRMTYQLSRAELASRIRVDTEKIIAIENGYGDLEEAQRILRTTHIMVAIG